MHATLTERPLAERATEVLRRAGNPFRNYFARNPDDEVCARYHVPELYATERDMLLGVVDLYRYDPTTHSEVVPVLGNKGAGKTHLLHSIKHGTDGAWQLLVTPGVYQKDTDFLEYLLFQIIDTLLGGGTQKGVRPLEFIGEELVRRLLAKAVADTTPAERLELFPASGLGKWARRIGLGQHAAQERAQWLVDALSHRGGVSRPVVSVRRALDEAGLAPDVACQLLERHVGQGESHNSMGLMRRAVFQGFARATLLGDEADLAGFLTYGFAELQFNVRPTRQDLVLALFKVLTEVFRGLKVPVVVAFDQLEDLLLARRSDDAHKVAEAFFAGIVQVMHQIDGLCFLIFAERGLWNRFVPSLDGYIQDRLNNPVHVPQYGTVQALRLEAPPAELVMRVVEARLRPALEELPDFGDLSPIYPFAAEQVTRVARTEPTLRDMLQQYRHLFDKLVYGGDDSGLERGPRSAERVETSAAVAEPAEESAEMPAPPTAGARRLPPDLLRLLGSADEADTAAAEVTPPVPVVPEFDLSARPGLTSAASEDVLYDDTENSSVDLGAPPPKTQRLTHADFQLPPVEDAPSSRMPIDVSVRSVVVVETPPLLPEDLAELGAPATMVAPIQPPAMGELWEQEWRSARRRLEPEGSLTGAARELQAGLGSFLQLCHEHGVKVGPWRLQHVVGEWTYGDHPSYGAVTIAHWACKDGQPWKVGIGLFLGRGAGKPKDLEIKLQAMEAEPPLIDHLILLRPEDDLALGGKSKTLWQEAERNGRHARIEAVSLDTYAQIAAFPRWLSALAEAQPEGQPLPNLADFLQERCERLLEQVCMPVLG
jgi:hypothetical protein